MRYAGLFAATIAAIVTGILCPAADAAASLKFSAERLPSGTGAAVYADGMRVMTIRKADEGPARIALVVALRLSAAAEDGATAGHVRVTGERAMFTLWVGARPIITITKRLAYSNGSTPEGLASAWKGSVRCAFSLPYIMMRVSEQTIPVGDQRVVALGGNLAQGVRAEGADAIVNWKVESGNRLVLTGKAPGRAVLSVITGNARLPLNIWVAKYAGRVTPSAAAIVTGISVPRSIIRKAALLAARQVVQPEEDAEIRLLPPAVATPRLPYGQSTTATVGVGVSGAEYLPVFGEVAVTVVNHRVERREPEVLMVSNNPEKLGALGLWYHAPIEHARPARLLYHHVNDTGGSATLIVELENSSAVPARVQILEGIGGPGRDEIFVGHVAARDFLERQSEDVGYLINLPPGQRYAAAVHEMSRGHVVSGLMEFRLLDPGSVFVNLRMVGKGKGFLLTSAPGSGSAPREVTHVFPNPRKTIDATYRVGGNWAFIRVGDSPLSDGNKSLAGNYGVTYEVRITIENPAPAPADVELALSASAGPARGVFLVDGATMEAPLLRAYQEARVARFRVNPMSTRQVKVRTMPQSGSNYPVRLIVRPYGARSH